jgi:opacity protein-like surface antigen
MFLRIAVLSALATAAAWAADVTGKWTGQVSGPDGGGINLMVTFQQTGTKLTGTIEGAGEPLQVQDGKVEGDKITFKVSFNGMNISHDGTVKGDEITFAIKMDGGDGPGPITLKRAK